MAQPSEHSCCPEPAPSLRVRTSLAARPPGAQPQPAPEPPPPPPVPGHATRQWSEVGNSRHTHPCPCPRRPYLATVRVARQLPDEVAKLIVGTREVLHDGARGRGKREGALKKPKNPAPNPWRRRPLPLSAGVTVVRNHHHHVHPPSTSRSKAAHNRDHARPPVRQGGGGGGAHRGLAAKS